MKVGRLVLPTLVFLLVVLLGSCQDKGVPDQDIIGAGFSPEKLEEAVDLFRKAIAEGRVTGVQLLVARNGKVVLNEALGLRSLENHLPMEKDTLIRMASVTKAVVTTGFLTLVDEGKVKISDPVSKYLPGFDEGLSSHLTIKHILTYTTGIENQFSNYVGDITPYSKDNPDAPSLIVEAVKIGKRGLFQEPGQKYRYSNQGLTVLGGLIEAISGQKLDIFLKERLYDPLGMTDTSHAIYGHDPDRVSSVYRKTKSGWRLGSPETPPFARASGGLVTTATDFWPLLQMLLNGGVYNGHRFLSEALVKEATTVQFPTKYLYIDPEVIEQYTIGMDWYEFRDARLNDLEAGIGYSWMIGKNGAFHHAGYWSTFAYADPKENMVILIFSQGREGGSPAQEFIDTVYAARQ